MLKVRAAQSIDYEFCCGMELDHLILKKETDKKNEGSYIRINAIVPSLEGCSRAYITCRTEAKDKDRALSSRHQLQRQLKAVGRFNASTSMTAAPRGVSRHWAVEWCSFNRAALSNGTLAERPQAVVSMPFRLPSFVFLFISFASFLSLFSISTSASRSASHFSRLFFFFLASFRRELRIICPFFPKRQCVRVGVVFTAAEIYKAKRP